MNPFESLLTGNVLDDVSLVHKAEPPEQPESSDAPNDSRSALSDDVVSPVVEHLLDSYSDKALQKIISGLLIKRPHLQEPVGESLHKKVKACSRVASASSLHYDEQERLLITRVHAAPGITIPSWQVPKFVTVETAALLIGSEQAFLTGFRKKFVSNQETILWRVESDRGMYAVQKSRASAFWEVLILER